MRNSKLIAVLIAVTVLSGLALQYNFNTGSDVQNRQGSHDMSVQNGQKPSKNDGKPFAELEAEYAAMKGEAYDKAFVTEMIVHHQGAVSMAHLALAKAKHPELKNMAQSIIDSQMREIRQLETWKKQWGYSTANQGSGMMAGMDHGNGEMEEMMTKMTNDLRNLSGDEFDKAFLNLMIEHHQSAIAMARPGITNAGRQEIKDLAFDIVAAQTQEIAQMKDWQQEWGYKE